MANDHEALRRFVAGGLCDLIGFLDEVEDPFIVGERYSRDKLIAAFTTWLTKRGISVKDADATGWVAACNKGALKAFMEDTDDSTK